MSQLVDTPNRTLFADSQSDVENELDKFVRLFEMRRRITLYDINFKDLYKHIPGQVDHQAKQFEDRSCHDKFLDGIQSLNNAVDVYVNSRQELLNYIDTKLREYEIAFIQKDYKSFYHLTITAEESIERYNEFSPQVKEYFESLVTQHSYWQFASADINPTGFELTRSLQASDPLYVVANEDLMKYVEDHYNKTTSEFFTARRLRKYNTIEELPDNGIGQAFCFGKYEHWPLDPFKEEASIIYRKLRDGGKFYFTYNNCEKAPSLEFCGGFRAYQTESLVSNMLYGLGFDKVENIEFNNGTHTVMIVKKPGELESKKSGPASVDIVKVIDSHPQ